MNLDRLANGLRSIIPDPFVIAIGLTLVAFVVGLGMGVGPTELVEGWVSGHKAEGASSSTGGLWSLLKFAMQMCLILVTGYVVANTKFSQGALARLAKIPRSTSQAVVLISLCAMALALFNWGLGLIAGALLAREVGISMESDAKRVHYPILAAAGYTGLCVWHGGFSGSAPLKVTQLKGLEDVLGTDLAAKVGALPLTETVLSPRNLIATGLILVVIPLVLVWMVPKSEADFVRPPTRSSRRAQDLNGSPGFAGRLERLPIFSLLLAGMGCVWLAPWAWTGGFMRLNPDSMNLCFIVIGLVLAGGPLQYMRLAEEAAKACAGIIVQFPFYGGILGLLAAGGVIELMLQVMPTSASSLGLFTFFSAGLFNLFVPSGGGQWAVQGPLVMSAAVENGVDPGRIVMALSWGDQWTNLFQPFWALPLLGITGTRAGDILGYTMLLGVVVGTVFGLAAFIG